MLEVAIAAAQEAGEIVARYFKMVGLEREIKDDTTFVTKADSEAEAIIVSHIQKAFPDHGILGEEGDNINPDAEYRWVVDPLDGTRNFINGIPLFAISIAVVKDNKPIVGVLFNPVTNSLYAAELGKGTTYNGRPVTVSSQKAEDGVLTLGSITSARDHVSKLYTSSAKFFKSTRILACCALELGYVARGGTEAYICFNHKQWDYAAGQLLVTEAGGKITDLDGNPCDLSVTSFMASNGVAHDAIKALNDSVSV